MKSFFYFLCLLLLLQSPPTGPLPAAAAADSAERVRPPAQVVSLVPAITEMLVAFGRQEALVGVTYQDMVLQNALRARNVGSCFAPNLDAIAACAPDLVIAGPRHTETIAFCRKHGIDLWVMEARHLEEAFGQMARVGTLFDREAQAAAVIGRNRELLALVKEKTARIPEEKKKRVARVMAGETLTCPGDDTFQNEMIAAAGGIAPRWGQTGFAVPVDLAQWQGFDAQVIYGCHDNEKAVRDLVGRQGWKEVAAVRDGAVRMFPCALTCMPATRIGDFVYWLAATLYLEHFADPRNVVRPNKVLAQRPMALDLDYVESVRRVDHRVADATLSSLVIRFKQPQAAVSTLDGTLAGLRAVGNTYIPMPASLVHMAYGVDGVAEDIRVNLGFAAGEFTTLMTGAEMRNLAVGRADYKDIAVTALVTAGVKGNALRSSKDAGLYYRPGTINILLLTNRRLTEAAMLRAIVTITEAKTAALLDMDIRSSYTGPAHGATGTGTDNIIVVQGEGPPEPYTGGHTKMGELIAAAVHAGVTDAIFRQNGLAVDRDVFQRLADRRLTLARIAAQFPSIAAKMDLASGLADLLIDPYYAAFVETALAVSDDYGTGLIEDPAIFDAMCLQVAARIAGKPVPAAAAPDDPGPLPVVLHKAFGALASGLAAGKAERRAP